MQDLEEEFKNLLHLDKIDRLKHSSIWKIFRKES